MSRIRESTFISQKKQSNVGLQRLAHATIKEARSWRVRCKRLFDAGRYFDEILMVFGKTITSLQTICFLRVGPTKTSKPIFVEISGASLERFSVSFTSHLGTANDT